jgi:hypothetical protein
MCAFGLRSDMNDVLGDMQGKPVVEPLFRIDVYPIKGRTKTSKEAFEVIARIQETVPDLAMRSKEWCESHDPTTATTKALDVFAHWREACRDKSEDMCNILTVAATKFLLMAPSADEPWAHAWVLLCYHVLKYGKSSTGLFGHNKELTLAILDLAQRFPSKSEEFKELSDMFNDVEEEWLDLIAQ